VNLGLDPAAELVTLCARCTFDERQHADIRATIARGMDWRRALELAEKNYVLPLLFEGLASCRDVVPEATYQQLAAQRKLLKFRAELFADELLRVSTKLDAAGITVLHYKGPVSADLLYGDRYRRTYFDLDFLVRREDLRAVSRLLRDGGYRCDVDLLTEDSRERFEHDQKEYSFVSGLICIEPHWSLTARRYPFPIDYAGLWQRAVVHDVGGTRLRTFAPIDMLLILSMAGAKAKWKRLQMIADVAQFYRSMQPELAQPVLERAVLLGCERIVLVAAHLAETLLEAPIPAAIRARTEANRAAVEKISARVIRSLFSLKPKTKLLADSPHLFSPLLFSMRERARDRLTYFVQTTTVATPVHFQRFPLPKWGYPAYRVIVPVYDYVVTPAGRSLRALLSAPRMARSGTTRRPS
jgi:hypothetical protein